MPKPIPLLIQVEEIAFGKVWRFLTAMPGVVSVDLNVGREPQSKRQYNKKEKAGYDPSAISRPKVRPMLLRFFADGKPHQNSEFQSILDAAGISSRAGQVAHNCLRAGLVKAIKPGIFQITAKGRKAIEKLPQET